MRVRSQPRTVPPGLGSPGLLFPSVGDHLYLYLGAHGQTRHGEAGAGRIGRLELLGIELVHGGEVPHIGEEHRALHHVVPGQAGSLQGLVQIGKALEELLLKGPRR